MIKLFRKDPSHYAGDMSVYLVPQSLKKPPTCGEPLVQRAIDAAHRAGDFVGKLGQTLLLYPEPEATLQVKRVLVVGLGKGKLSRELLRQTGGTVAKKSLATKAQRILLVVPELSDLPEEEICECLTEGVLLGGYRFLKYKAVPQDEDEKPRLLKQIHLHSGKPSLAAKGVKRGKLAAVAACKCRDMANEPGNHWTASHFAEYAENIAQRHGFGCEILSKPDLQRLGLNGILAVNRGSAEPPKLITLTRLTGKKVPKLMLVGKGLTFDSGGISLKPGENMHEMKYDMCGGAAVLAAMDALGEEGNQELDLVAMVPATDNLIGPEAVKPGDVITMYGGKTVEVVNTDAEGRLILADAIAYGVEKYQPDMIVDLATLTGAVIIALGNHHTGLLANNDKLARLLIKAGERSGEPLWRLPLGKEYTKQLKSEVADLKNIGGKGGGAITGAAFLQEFVGKAKWAHLDIAGTAWNFTEKSYIPKGPSGIGVRTLLELIRAGL